MSSLSTATAITAFPLTDALIAAAAAQHGGLAVLHREDHFDRLAQTLAFDSVMLPGP